MASAILRSPWGSTQRLPNGGLPREAIGKELIPKVTIASRIKSTQLGWCLR